MTELCFYSFRCLQNKTQKSSKRSKRHELKDGEIFYFSWTVFVRMGKHGLGCFDGFFLLTGYNMLKNEGGTCLLPSSAHRGP